MKKVLACVQHTTHYRAMWPNRDPLGDLAFLKSQLAVESQRDYESLKSQSTAPGYDFIQNDPLNNLDINGLVPAAAGVCIVVITLPADVPVGAIVVGTVVVAGVTYVTYRVCEEICPVICMKVNEINQPPHGKPGDPDYMEAMKICVYRCSNLGLVRRYFPEGTKCKPYIMEQW